MSQADFKKAGNRLKRAKKEVLWALAVLEDPTANLKGYNLTPDEEEELFQEYHEVLADIQSALTQLFSKKSQIMIESKMVTMVGPIPPWLSRLESVESVGPVPPWSKEEGSV